MNLIRCATAVLLLSAAGILLALAASSISLGLARDFLVESTCCIFLFAAGCKSWESFGRALEYQERRPYEPSRD